MKDFDQNIWIAKNNSKIRKDALEEDESAAIRLYTMQWSDSDDNLCTILRNILRAEKRNIPKLFLTALFKLPSKKGVVWRGVHGNIND